MGAIIHRFFCFLRKYTLKSNRLAPDNISYHVQHDLIWLFFFLYGRLRMKLERRKDAENTKKYLIATH